jgi:hypothetical protein
MLPPCAFDMRTARAYALAWSWALRRVAQGDRIRHINTHTGLPGTTNASEAEQNARASYLLSRPDPHPYVEPVDPELQRKRARTNAARAAKRKEQAA